MTPHTTNNKPKFSAKIIAERFQMMRKWAEEASHFARALDWLGDANQHPEGSEQRDLAQVRDEVDDLLTRCSRQLAGITRLRAETTWWVDLMVDVIADRMGDGADALHLMRRYHALFGDEKGSDGETPSETFPDMFAWDTYQRVSNLTALAEQFPKHIRHGARAMHGWPMIVSRHLDCTHEFRRLAELLELGAEYPLDVGPRKRRGTDTPMLHYLEPLVWRLHVLRKVLLETEKTRGHEDFKGRLSPTWWDTFDKEPTPEVVAILKLVPQLPPLTRKTAREWSSKVLVPIIWNHKSVKSRATFRSRLHSAVMDTLQRFGRPD